MGATYYPTTELPSGQRVFSNQHLQSAIDRAIANAGDDHVIVVAHHDYTEDGQVRENVTKLSLLVRVNDQFSVSVAAYKDWDKDIGHGVGAEVVWKPSFLK